ncbi:MAG: translational GTPase TypA [Spirochaetes bacterium]|nr:translational GTPase TypA [Spirochaetota bacterium]
MQHIRNIAIIAHVDHGKTTLVDAMLRQSGTFRSNERVEERIMDSNDLEKERGITIFSKNASFFYRDHKINIVDTPGHADFGGEVQRILNMVDSVLLVVDAFEGPMPQTKYVLKKSLEAGHRPIVVVNKIDRPNCRPEQVVDMLFDLFIELNATDEQLDFPVIYASAKTGESHYSLNDEHGDMVPLFETIIRHVCAPGGDTGADPRFLISAIEYDNYVGKIGTGKLHHGVIRSGDEVKLVKQKGALVNGKITHLYEYRGLKKIEVEEATAGDIVAIAGFDTIDLGDTIAGGDNPTALPSIRIDEPTIAITFQVNDSPFLGREGKYVTSRHIWERLERETETNVSLVIERAQTKDSFTVKGRGELQLSILIENMRREGYEFQISRPQVIYREIEGNISEPMEIAIVDVADEFSGVVIEKLGKRRAELASMVQGSDGYTRLEFRIPSRGLIGCRNEFLTDTRGTGILNHVFDGYEPFRGPIPSRSRGVLIAIEDGVSNAYALDNLQERGNLFIGPGVPVYEGMIIGENSRENDMEVNPCKTKKLTNMRASGSDEAIRLTPPRLFSLEQAIEYIDDDELLEVTPKSIRMRKRILKCLDRKRFEKAKMNDVVKVV